MSAASCDPGILENAARGAVPAHGADVVAVRERLQPRGVEVYDGDVVVVVQRLDDRRADLTRPE